MDIDPQVTIESVEVKTMAEDLKAQVLTLDANLYPEKISIDFFTDSEARDIVNAMGGQTKNVQIDSADLFTLRAFDRPTMSNFKYAKGQKVKAIASFGYVKGQTESAHAGKHLDHDYDTAKGVEEQSKAEKSTQAGKRKRDTKPTKPKPQPSDDAQLADTVKFAVCLDTQTPHLQVSVLYEKDRVMSTCIYAKEMKYGEDGFVLLRAFDMPGYDSGDDTFPAPWHQYAMLSSLSKVKSFCVSVPFVKQDKPRVWSGISEHEMSQMRASIDAQLAQDPPMPLGTRDTLVALLDSANCNGTDLWFGFSIKSSEFKLWTTLLDRAQRLFTIARHNGNFWWYRRQCEINGISNQAIDRVEMPHCKFSIPRWLVTAYDFAVTTFPDGRKTYSNPRPSRWHPLYMEKSYPNANEAAFLMKLGIDEERQFQVKAINELLKSDDCSWFRARLRPISDYRFIVEVNYGVASERLAEQDVKLPGPGTRIRFAMDRDGVPTIINKVEFSGTVVNNIDDIDCAFICVANMTRGRLHVQDFGGEYPILIGYVIDAIPFERQMAAVQQLQACQEFAGPDVRSLLFGCAPVASSPAKLSVSISKDNLARATSALDDSSLNELQRKAAELTFTSKTGRTLISAPFGTGKTLTQTVIADAHLRAGHKVLSIAPSNAAVRTQVEHFMQHNSSLSQEYQLDDNEFCFFTGGHWRVKNAGKLQSEQKEREDADADAADFYRLRDASTQERPNYEWTFGYKLDRQIRQWATLEAPTNDGIRGPDVAAVWTAAKEFLDIKDNIRFMAHGDNRKDALEAYNTHEYNLAWYFMQHYMKHVFCTINTAAHELVIEGGPWHNCNCDEAGQETLSGLAVALGAHVKTVWHWTFAGDAKQLEGVILSQGRNVGYRQAARSLFRELTEEHEIKDDHENPRGKDVVMLTDCFRMPKRLLDWPDDNVYNGKLLSVPTA